MAEAPSMKVSVPTWLLQKYNNFNKDGDDAFFKDNLQPMIASLLEVYPSILSPNFRWEWRSLEIDYHIHEFLVVRDYLPAGGPWAVPPSLRRRVPLTSAAQGK